MMSTSPNRAWGTVIAALLAVLCASALPAQGQSEPPESVAPVAAAEFAQSVDLRAFELIAVHTEGRVKSMDSFARGVMQAIAGPRDIDGQSPTFTYLDMMIRPERYDDRPIIFVKLKPLRYDLARALALNEEASAEAARTGLFTPRQMSSQRAQRVLSDQRANVLTTEKFVSMVDTAMAMRRPEFLWSSLRIVPTPEGSPADPWMGLEEFDMSERWKERAAATTTPAIAKLVQAWIGQDAATATAAANDLAAVLPTLNPAVYPERGKLEWEHWYFKNNSMIWIWLVYGAALVPLLLSVVFRWSAARWLGLGVFLAALGLHTFAVGLRWYVSGRWPNSNMFEAITTAAWFGGVAALVLELFVARTAMRSLFALGASAAAMTGWMAVKFFPLELNANIGNMMPVLHDIWLYIHTNVIIFSYCLIFIAAVTAALYLAYRTLLAMGIVGGGSAIRGADEYARVGGAGSLLLTRPDGTRVLEGPRTTFGQVLDGTTMVVMELSFVMLWAGLVMGAIWADHSWGRPWGWDPKEVFALNTFIIFLLLVHVRLKVKDKGLWTAVLAVIGAAVMIFNWVIINFTISGLHSYA